MAFATDDRLVHRAMAAYFRSGGTDQPANRDVIAYDGRLYVVLSNINGTLAVYRVRPSDGVLRRLKRWPTVVSGRW